MLRVRPSPAGNFLVGLGLALTFAATDAAALEQAAAAPAQAQAAAANSGQATAAAGEPASAARKALAKKQVGALVNAIRFDKRSLADKYLAFDAMAERLLTTTRQELTPPEQAQFQTDFKALLVNTAFPKGHKLFAYLDGILYGEAREKNGELHLTTTIVVHRNVKKTEMPVEWVLVTERGSLKVVDVVSLHESTIAGVRDEEVAPLLREGGKEKLLRTLHDKAAGASKSR